MNPFEWFNPGQQPPGPVDPWQATALPPQPPVPQRDPLPSPAPRIGKPIGPDVPEPKWSEAPKPQAQSSHPLSGLIGDAAKKYGLDPRSLGAMMMIESGGNPNLVNKLGYSGLFQFQPKDFAKRGGQGSVLDPAANTDVAARKFADMTKRFQAQRGRAPTSAELYLMHQQGEGGAAAHWGAPDKPAWQNMLSTAEGRQKGAEWAKRAIWGNVPDDVKARFGSVDNITSADFSKLWADKVARHEQRFEGGAPGQITAQAMSPTSTTPSQASQPRSRGMIDVLKGLFGGQAQTAEQPAPTADSIIANLDRLGIAKDDPMRGTYEYLAQSLTGGRKAPAEMSPMMQGFGVFADTLGAGLGRRGGNTAAQPMFMQRLKMNKAEREKADDRGFQAPLKMLEAILPYRMKEIERQRQQQLLERALNGDKPAPIAPGGAQGVQIPNTAPLAPVQRAELPPLGAPSPAGGPPAAGLPPQPQMAPGAPQAPGGPPAPQHGAASPTGAPGVALPTPDQPPSGPGGPGSKFRTSLEKVVEQYPLIPPETIKRVMLVDPARAKILQAQNDDTLKERDQMIKLAEAHRDQGIAANLTPAQKAVDSEFAKDYAAFATGGHADAKKGLLQLREVMATLKDPNSPSLTGPFTGSLPDWYQSWNNPLAVSTREKVEEVVQRNLRAVLGAAFTEKEGERLIARAYNPRLDEKENAVRVGRLLESIETAMKSKVEATRYFEQHGTLAGFRGGHRISLGDIEKSAFGADGPAKDGKTPATSGQPAPEQIENLRKYASNPAAIAAFNKHWGQGAAEAILSGQPIPARQAQPGAAAPQAFPGHRVDGETF